MQTRKRQSVFLICLFLVVSTGAVYWQVLDFDFTNYDDHKYVTENPDVQQGLTGDSIRWAFTTRYASNWHPLTWLSLMLDWRLFGSNAGAFHLVNLLFHIVNTVLLFIVLSRCTAAVWLSGFVAAAFGLHPLHVESVAWIVERKDVLSTLFWMLTMLAYVRYVEKPGVARYAAALVALGLGLMTKPMLVTLPCVLLLLDYWPLGRANSPPGVGGRKSLFSLVLEKIPFFVLAAASSLATFIAQKSGGTVATMEVFSLKVRLANALVSYASYIAKMFWPGRLAVFYPHPGDALPIWQIAAAVAVLLGISAWVILRGRRKRYLVVGWLWYLGTLLPVIGLVQVGAQAMADRYTYVPLTGLFIIVAWSIRDLVAQWRYRKVIVVVLGSVLCVALMMCTWIQVGYWRNSVTLFEHALNVTSNNYVAHNNLGIALAEEDNTERAMEHFRATLRIRPDDIDAHFNLAKALAGQDRIDEAIPHYNEVLRLKPGDADTHNSLGLALAEQGRLEQAVDMYRRGLEFNPQDASLHCNLGVALFQQGELDEAISEFETAVELKPESESYNNMAIAMASKGRLDEAIEYHNEAIRLGPENAEARYNLANALLAQGKLEKSIAEYKEAVRIRPTYAKAYGNLAVALSQQGKLDEAINYFAEAVRLQPDSADARYNLAGALLEKGRIEEAVNEYRRVLQLEPRDADTRCILGDTLILQGRAEEAAAEYREALKINPKHPKALLGLKNALAKQDKSNQTKK